LGKKEKGNLQQL
jgi:chromosome segregation ATPase